MTGSTAIRVVQACPQCGADIELVEAERVLTCPFCGASSFLLSAGPFRYVLPLPDHASSAGLLLAPYLRFKGTIFLVTATGIEHRVIDTTQAANNAPGLPPSLGVRPQAMRLSRISPETGNLFLPQQLKASAILDKAASVGNLAPHNGEMLYHRAYIGEHLSYIYLPLMVQGRALYDGVTRTRLLTLDQDSVRFWQGQRYNEDWQVRSVATICPKCGAALDGAADCQVMTCAICAAAWSLAADGLEPVDWQVHRGDGQTALYLPFWKIATHIPALQIYSFADFVERTNQPFLPRPQWRERVMSLWVPAVRLRPKNFLQLGRHVTLGQWRLQPQQGRREPGLYTVTLPAAEARQSVKLMLAAATASPRLIYPSLPQVRLTSVTTQLVYLPFVDQGHDWVQPETGAVVSKNILSYGRTLSF